MTRNMAQMEARKNRFVARHIRPPAGQPERLYHKECGELVKKDWWFTKDRVPICVSCDRRVTEQDLLTYEEWSALCNNSWATGQPVCNREAGHPGLCRHDDEEEVNHETV